MTTHHIICYDIADKRRLARVHALLKRQATALQYSVFLFSGTEQQLNHCLAQLAKIMHPRQDDIRAYPLPARGHRIHMGPSTLPEGIYLSSLPAGWQNPH